MAYTGATTTTLSNTIAPVYIKQFIETLSANTEYRSACREQAVSANAGQTVYFNSYAALPVATTALTEGTNPSGTNLSTTLVTATANEYGDYTKVSSKVSLVSIDDRLIESSKILGDQAARTIDQLIKTEMENFTTIKYANGKAAVSTTGASDILTVAGMANILRVLQNNNVRPYDDNFYKLFVNPDTGADLQSDTSWRNVQLYNQTENLVNATIGKINKFNVVMSTNPSVASVSGGAANAKVYNNIATGKDSIACVTIDSKDVEMFLYTQGNTENPLNMYFTHGWKLKGFVPKVLDNSRGVLFRSGATNVG